MLNQLFKPVQTCNTVITSLNCYTINTFNDIKYYIQKVARTSGGKEAICNNQVTFLYHRLWKVTGSFAHRFYRELVYHFLFVDSKMVDLV